MVGLPVFWSVRALNQHWRISRQQLYEAHRSGRIRGFRILGTLRFLESDLVAYLKEAGVPFVDQHSNWMKKEPSRRN